MTKREILQRVAHTQLKASATGKDIRKLCDETVEYQTALAVEIDGGRSRV